MVQTLKSILSLENLKAQLNSDGDEAIKKAQANKINADAIALLIDKGMSPSV